jgi:pimeloyl-ACP methyl ester carboxylesterase
MLNRLSGDVDAAELVEFAGKFKDLDEWINESLRAAEAAEAGQKFDQAASYYRGAEFFMPPGHERKLEAYERYMAFFTRTHPEVEAMRLSVPFEGGELGVIDIAAVGEEKDIIVACSGFDGLIEEMYDSMTHLAREGFRVVLYEGPGQGSALRRCHLTMTHEWEKPVAAVLDHLNISSCTLLGLSLGGYLAPRAAAFEPRVKRLIAWGAMYDFFGCFKGRMNEQTFAGLSMLVESGARESLNEILYKKMQEDTTARWSTEHGMHTCGGKDPFDFFSWAKQLHLRDVSPRIKQDTLIIAGSEDHLVPSELIWEQSAALVNARSITVRVFSKLENASEHCQVTNPGVVIGEIARWLDALSDRGL